MTSQERSAAIYAAVEAFHDTLDSLKVETSIVAASIDDTPKTGYGVSRVKGNSNIVMEMLGQAVKALPPTEFRILLVTMATGDAFAANRGEDPQPQDAAIKPTLVN